MSSVVMPGPQSIRLAGILGAVQGSICIIFALVLAWEEYRGFRDEGADIKGTLSDSVGYGYGTALWFILVGAAILCAGIFLYQGRRWGRGPVVMTQIILLPISYYMFSSGRPELAIPTVIVACFGLGLLFNPVAVDWAAQRYQR